MIFYRPHLSLLAGLMVLAGSSAIRAQVPHMIDYQGKIAVSGVNFAGAGQFKFALVNGAGDTTYWSHDGTSVGGAEPTTHVVRTVTAGLYSIVLGDTTVLNSSGAPVLSLDPAAFDHPQVHLRVWFNDGTNGFQLLSPDRRIAAVGYALMADSVADGSITTAKLAPGSVTADKLAPSAGGNLQVSLSSSDSTLIGTGYIKVQSIPAKPWVASTAVGAPSPRSHHTAVWTGSKMLIWGGQVGVSLSNQGGTYDPATASWTLLPTSSSSPARSDHTAVWTGERMIVWGGFTDSGESNTGAMYAPPVPESDPPIGGWLATSTVGAPQLRSGHTAVWTGTKMVIWGGKNGDGVLGTGGAYIPPMGPLIPGTEGFWSATQTTGAPAARHQHTAIWTGSKMIVWGGLDSAYEPINSGGIYDPVTDAWTTLATAGAPSPRTGHSAVWTGAKMVIFGGSNTEVPGSAADLFADGAAYDPVSGLWTPLATTDAPSARFHHGAVWTGSEMLIFGGELSGGQLATTGAAYRPAADSWRPLSPSAATAAGQTGLWSGAEVLVFGANGLRLLDLAPAVHLYGKF